jgi:hypothetical protein
LLSFGAESFVLQTNKQKYNSSDIQNLKETVLKNKLIVFERKVLGRIFVPTKERNSTWRIKTNGELDELIRYKNIINYIKAQRVSWFGHLHRMLEERMLKKGIRVETDVNTTTR